MLVDDWKNVPIIIIIIRSLSTFVPMPSDTRFYLKRIKLLFVNLIFLMLSFNVCRGKFMMADFGMSFESPHPQIYEHRIHESNK